MNYYELVQLADKINNSISHLIIRYEDVVLGDEYSSPVSYIEGTLKELREIQINAELLKDRLLGLNLNNVIITAEEVEE